MTLTVNSTPEEVREAWAARLEANTDKQTTGRLGRRLPDGTDCFCGLGVLTEMAVEAGVAVRKDPQFDHGAYRYGSPDDGYGSIQLPVAVARWAGLPSRDPETSRTRDDGDQDSTLCFSELNDELELTLPELAEVVREEFL